MLVSACSVNITLVFIMSGGCVTKVHLDTWDLMCLLLSLSPQGSLYLKLWAELYSQHFTISAFQTVPGQQATLHCPPTVYSLTAQHCIHSPLPSRCWSTCDWPVHCVCRGLASPSLSRAAFQFDVTGPGFWDPLGIIDFLTSVIVWNEFYSCLIVNYHQMDYRLPSKMNKETIILPCYK